MQRWLLAGFGAALMVGCSGAAPGSGGVQPGANSETLAIDLASGRSRFATVHEVGRGPVRAISIAANGLPPDGGPKPLPQYVGLTAGQVAASPYRPACLYGDNLVHPLTREAYVTGSAGIDACFVAWIGDTGQSRVFNIDAAWDEFDIYVKRAGDDGAVSWHPVGAGVGPVGGEMVPSLDDFDLALDGDATGSEAVEPVVVWVASLSVHFDGADLYVVRWDGTSWQPMQTVDGSARLNALPEPPGFGGKPEASLPKLARTDDGHLMLTWTEGLDGPPARFQRTWDGQAWSAAQQLP